MKKRIYLLIVALAFSFGLSVSAQDFNTGSDLMNTGSSYSSTVGSVGATGVNDMYTTASAPTRTVGARKVEDPGNPDPGPQDEDHSPIGEPLVMLFFAAAAGVVIALRRRKAQA